MNPEGDELLAMVREAVRIHGVPPAQQAAVTEVVGRAIVTVMSQPRFYNNLKVVLELRDENAILRQQLANLSATVYRAGMVRSKPPTKRPTGPRKTAAKKSTAKKAAPRKKAPPRPKQAGPAADVYQQAFKDGFHGR